MVILAANDVVGWTAICTMGHIEMLSNKQDLSRKFADLKLQYIENLQLAIETMESIWATVLDDPDDAASLQKLQRAAHKLAGSGATFGFVAVSEAGQSLELVLQELKESGSEATFRQFKKVDTLLEQLKSVSSDSERPTAATCDVSTYASEIDRASKSAFSNNENSKPGEEDHTPKILIADDDPFVLRAIKLEFAAYHVDLLEATKGREAFNIAFKANPDLIITDHTMPDGTGQYLLNRLRHAAQTKDTPVIVITASKIEGKTDHALKRDMLGQLRASEYIEKPLEPGQIVRTVGKHLRLRAKSESSVPPPVLGKEL